MNVYKMGFVIGNVKLYTVLRIALGAKSSQLHTLNALFTNVLFPLRTLLPQSIIHLMLISQ